MKSRILDRLYTAIMGLDLGIPGVMVGRDLLRSANLAASSVGGPKIKSLDDSPSVRRLVVFLESSAE